MQQIKNDVFLAFIPSDNYLTWHRAPLLEAIKTQCKRSDMRFVVYQRPVIFTEFLKSLFKKRSSRLPCHVKDLYTLLPASLASKNRLIFYVFFVLPIFLQVRKNLSDSTLLWFCKPSQLDFLKSFKGKFLFEIYDNYAADNAGLHFSEKQKLERTFNDAIEKSYYSFFSNFALYEKTNKRNKVYFPNAVSDVLLNRALINNCNGSFPEEVVIGFVGVVSNQIDLEVLVTILTEKPEWKVEVVGRIDKVVSGRVAEIARSFPQLKVFGAYYYEDLYKYIPNFTVGLCPYIKNSFNTHRNPMKIYEFAAFGLPTIVLGCQLDEEQKVCCYEASLCNVVSTIKTALEEKKRKSEEIMEFAQKNTWEKRAITLSQYF